MPHDGTQDPGPPPLMPDALTGSTYDTEPLRVRVVEPVMPDMSAVREEIGRATCRERVCHNV